MGWQVGGGRKVQEGEDTCVYKSENVKSFSSVQLFAAPWTV